jgi:lysylphosphatidylglycerol synthetase-like protein (DUF2156 family)
MFDFSLEAMATMLLYFSLNTVIVFMIVVGLYARTSKRRQFYFSYFALSMAIFLMCYILVNVNIQIGFALGLFAIFGIIRYRTDTVPIKEMTYLFVIIAISVLNALANNNIGFLELIFANLLLVGGLYLLERILILKQENSHQIVYDKIENIHEDQKEVLLADLQARTGRKINRYDIKSIDFSRNIAIINVVFEVIKAGK